MAEAHSPAPRRLSLWRRQRAQLAHFTRPRLDPALGRVDEDAFVLCSLSLRRRRAPGARVARRGEHGLEQDPVSETSRSTGNGAGHAQAIYVLRRPVLRGAAARPLPLAALAHASEWLRQQLQADAGFTGVLVSNPVHSDYDHPQVAHRAVQAYRIPRVHIRRLAVSSQPSNRCGPELRRLPSPDAIRRIRGPKRRRRYPLRRRDLRRDRRNESARFHLLRTCRQSSNLYLGTEPDGARPDGTSRRGWRGRPPAAAGTPAHSKRAKGQRSGAVRPAAHLAARPAHCRPPQ